MRFVGNPNRSLARDVRLKKGMEGGRQESVTTAVETARKGGARRPAKTLT